MPTSIRQSRVLRNAALSALAAACLIFTGCSDPAKFRVETKIHADGFVEREIYQPSDGFLPLEAFTPEWNARWTSVSAALTDGTPVPNVQPKESQYFVAQGTFPTVADIPSHYRYANADHPELGASEIRHTYEKLDCAFFVEHRWKEEITNIVTLEGFLAARDEALDIVLEEMIPEIEAMLGDQYDVTKLAEYVRTEGRRFAEEAALSMYDSAARHVPEVEAEARILAVALRFGLDLRSSDGKSEFVTGDELDARTVDFLTKLIATHVRYADGRRLNEDEATKLTLPLMGENGETPVRLDAAIERAMKRASSAWTRMVGLYGFPAFFLQRTPAYRFQVELPGDIVNTNATLLKRNRAEWKFKPDDIYPDGYTMRAVSLELDTEAQEKALGHVPLGDVNAALDFAELVRGHPAMLEALARVNATGNLDALDDPRFIGTEDYDLALKVRKILAAAD